MRPSILRSIAACIWAVFQIHQAAGQCSGCTTTYNLTSSSQTLSFTVSGGGGGQVICITKDPSVVGNATITSGTFDLNNRPNLTLCIGTGVVLASSVSISNPNNQFTLNNYGTLQNSLNLSQNQQAISNFGTISGPVSISNGTFNNNSGAIFSSSNLSLTGGSFVNNTGASFNLPGSFTAGSGSSFTGGGSFSVGGSFQTNNGSTFNISGPANISGSVTTNAPANFGSTLTVGGGIQSNNGGPITVSGAANITGNLSSNATISFGSSLSLSGNFQSNNGGPVTVAGAVSIGGSLQTNATTQFNSTLNLGGSAQINNGGPLTVSGAATIGGNLATNASTSFGSSLGIGGSLQVNNGGPLGVGTNLSIGGSASLNANVTAGGSLTISNSGNANPALQVNNGSSNSFAGGGNITGNFTNSGSVSFSGSLTATGTITNNNGGSISSASGACKTLCGASIVNNGSISSTSGPNLTLCVAPTGSGTTSNTTVSNTPTAGPTGLSLSVSGSTVSGTFSAASPAPGGYLVLRKTSAFTNSDMPVNGTPYSVGSTIGGATVVAFLNSSTTSFSYSDGCGSFFFAVISSSSSGSGSCSSYYTTSYATTSAATVSCAGPRYWVASSAFNWNSTSNWSVSSGGPSGASVPASGNLAIFDNARNGNCTINATVDVLGIQISGYTGTISQNANPMTLRGSGYSQSSGTFTGGSASIDLISAGLFTLTGGTFTSTSGTVTLSGNFSSNATLFTHSGGTFNHNNGSWVLNPSLAGCANPNLVVDVIPATLFNNLEFNGVAGCGINASLSTGTGDVVACANQFTHTDGALIGAFSFRGNLVIGAGADGGTGSLTANGTGAQTHFQAAGSPRTCQLVVNKSAGAFTPASGSTDLTTQGFSLVAGSFTAPSGTLNVGGNWGSNVTLFSHSGGTFLHNNGTVEFNPSLISCANPTLTVDVIPATSFFNFTVNGIAGCGINATLSTGTGDVIACANNLTHSDGVINGSFSFQGNLILQSGADGGTGTITANGTGAQTYSQATGSARTCQIVVNKPSGALTPAVGTTQFFVQSFNQMAGDFTAPSGTLNVGGNWGASVTIFGHAAGTFSHNNGTVEFNPSLINCANPTFTVDVIPATLLYNFVVNGIAGCGINATLSTAAGDVVQMANNFTHTDGFINGNFAFRNNLVINSGADGGTGTITANGSGAQTYSTAGGVPRTCQLIVNKPAGALTPAGGTIDLFTQGFQLQAGSFTAPSGTLNVGGNWGTSVTIFGHSGGTFSHNNGTVEFNPSLINCANPTFTIDVIPATQFSQFVVNGIAGCGINASVVTASGDVVQCLGDFTHSDGVISGDFSFRGNLWIYAGADGGTGTITADGTGAQTYFQASGSPRTCQLIVNKTSGALTPAVGATNLWTQGFQLLAGSFTAPSGTLNVGGNWGASVTIFGHSGGTFTHNNGTVEFNPSLINCANPTFTVDVIPATLLYNFVVNGIAGCGINATLSTATGDVVQAANDFTHIDGIINGNFAFRNNLVINAGADGGTGTITANGTGAQTYFQASGSPRTCQLIVNKTAGALTPAVGATDLWTQGFQLQAGSFTAPSGTLNVGGNWGASVTIFGHSGGTFSHNNGTVEFNPSLINCANPTFTVDVIPATLLYNFVVNGIAGCGINATISTATGDVVQAANDFTHNDGIINGNFAFRNNLVINAGADGGTGTITANGTGAQTYFQASGSPRTCQLIVNKTAGALTPAVGATNLWTQGFQLQAGSFTAPSGTLNVGGNWGASVTIFGHSGGTFTHNNGTVEFNPSLINCANPTFTVDVISGTQLQNLLINGVAGCGINPNLSTASGDTLEVLNMLTYNDGVSNLNLEVLGNVQVNPTFDGGAGFLLFKGGNSQNFDLNGANSLFDGRIILRKTGNSVTLASPCVLDAGVAQSVTFITGNLISTSSNLLTIGSGVTVSGASNASFVNGPVRKVGNQAFTFPLGKGTAYAAIGISAPGLASDHFTAEYFGVNPNSLYNVSSKELTLQSVSTCEYWNLERTNGTSNVTVTLSWDARSCAVSSVSTQGIARWNGSQWINQGRSAASGTTSAGSVSTCSAVSTFGSPGPFTLATVETATLSYSGSPFCSNVSGAQPVTFSGLISGTFSASPAGLSLNGTNGAVTPSTSTAGTYTVTYTVGSSISCANVTGTSTVVVSALPSATISYPLSTFCPSAAAQNVTRTGTAGGTYSALPSGLALNSSSGQITPSGSSANTYTITYTLTSAGCPVVTANASVTVRATGQWLGTTNNWNTAGNWCGGIPTSTTDVLIPTGVSNMPQINAASFARNLVVQSGASLVINGANSLSISGDFTNSGTFTPSSTSTVLYNAAAGTQAIVPASYGNLSTSGGAKTFSGSVSISGTFSPSASSHNAGTSTILFNGGSSQNIPAFSFYNLSTSGNNVKTMTGNVSVSNALNLGTGSLSIGANILNLGGSISGTGTLSGACSSTLTLSGAGSTGTLNFTSGSRTLGTFNLSKAGTGDVVLGTDLDICTSLNLSQGKVILGASNLTLLSTATTTAGNANSYVQTLDQMSPTGAGFFHRQVGSGAGELIFPVGTSTYTPAYLDNIGSTRTFKVRVFNDVFANGISGAPILNLDFSVRRTWEISPTGAGGTPNVAIRLQWNSSDEGMYFYTNRQTEKIYMGKNTGVGNSLWEKLITGDLDLTASPYSLTSARVTSFSKFAVGSDEAPLPVVMGQLNGQGKDGLNLLSWSTYSETESKKFEILRSEDGNQFEKIGELKAAGNSSDRISYRYSDPSGRIRSYYKIRMVGEKEGDVVESNVIRIDGTEAHLVEVYPQPAFEKVQVLVPDSDGKFDLELTDLQGRILPVRWEIMGSSSASLELANLPTGIYSLRIFMENGETVVRRILKK